MISVRTQVERWELVEPFTTARDLMTHVPVLLVTLIGRDGARGWAEAAGVDYDGETPETSDSAARTSAAAPGPGTADPLRVQRDASARSRALGMTGLAAS